MLSPTADSVGTTDSVLGTTGLGCPYRCCHYTTGPPFHNSVRKNIIVGTLDNVRATPQDVDIISIQYTPFIAPNGGLHCTKMSPQGVSYSSRIVRGEGPSATCVLMLPLLIRSLQDLSVLYSIVFALSIVVVCWCVPIIVFRFLPGSCYS